MKRLESIKERRVSDIDKVHKYGLSLYSRCVCGRNASTKGSSVGEEMTADNDE
jgi:hypothetical protein